MLPTSDLVSAVAEELDLSAAFAAVSGASNDLVPPRLEDKVPGQVRAGWLASLEAAVEEGVYRPDKAHFISVAKPNNTSRPAALLRLEDRVLYEALVAQLRTRIERMLDSPSRVYWPRGERAPKRWEAFEKASLDGSPSYIVMADVAGFYESIDHQRLRAVLLLGSAARPVVDALTAFLGDVMGDDRGLPQGLEPSDPLATAYLSSVDAALNRAGLAAFRNGDDLRISVPDYEEALRASHVTEQSLREGRLLLNTGKLRILRVETYAQRLNEVDEKSEELRNELERELAAAMLDAGESEDVQALLDQLTQAEDEQGGYDAPSRTDLIERLRPHVQVGAVELAWELLDSGLKARAAKSDRVRARVSDEDMHVRIVRSLRALSAARDARALEHVAALLIRHGSETEVVCGYLAALSEDHGAEVAAQVENVVLARPFMLDSQRSWLFRVLHGVHGHVSDELLAMAKATSESDRFDWLERLEALKLVALRGGVERGLLQSLWYRAPVVFRVDLIAAAASMREQADWAEGFLRTVNQDPLLLAVATNLRARPS